MGETFEITLTDGTKKQAKVLTTIKQEGVDTEYFYYSVEENDGNVSIYAAKLVKENGKDVMKNLDDENERQEAYRVFSETYKAIRESNK